MVDFNGDSSNERKQIILSLKKLKEIIEFFPIYKCFHTLFHGLFKVKFENLLEWDNLSVIRMTGSFDKLSITSQKNLGPSNRILSDLIRRTAEKFAESSQKLIPYFLKKKAFFQPFCRFIDPKCPCFSKEIIFKHESAKRVAVASLVLNVFDNLKRIQ